jgi:general secretion pathway protein G
MAKLRKRLQRGFTLIELMIVISMMLILLAIAIPAYQRAIVQSREAVLRSDLFTLRSLIQQYTLDKQKAPQSLDDLKSAGYLREIPKDPISGAADWTVDQDDSISSADQQDPGINDVHSSSSANSLDGTAYSSW